MSTSDELSGHNLAELHRHGLLLSSVTAAHIGALALAGIAEALRRREFLLSHLPVWIGVQACTPYMQRLLLDDGGSGLTIAPESHERIFSKVFPGRQFG